jgi:sugar (pentulose or hexulose) kinase
MAKYIGMDVGSTTVKALVVELGETQPEARRADMEMLPEQSEGGQER